jgi:hypothetical protein
MARTAEIDKLMMPGKGGLKANALKLHRPLPKPCKWTKIRLLLRSEIETA